MLNFNDASLFRGGSDNVPVINVADPQQSNDPNIAINPVAVNTGNPDFIPYTSSPEFLAMIQANADQMAAGGTPQTQLQSLSGGMKTSEPNLSVSGLFSPELSNLQASLYQQNQNQAMRDRFTQFAQLTPLQQASVGFQHAGYQLGQGVGGALGGQDPQLQLISQRNAITSQIDMTNPDSIYKAANLAVKSGDMQFANALADRAKALREAQVKQMQEGSTTTKNLAEAAKIRGEAETKNQTIQSLKSQFSFNDADATAIASNPSLVQAYLTPTTSKAFEAIKTGKYTPESAAIYARSGNLSDLDHIDMSAKPSEDWMKYARQLGLPSKASFGAYTPDEVAKVNDLQFKQDIALNQAKAMAIKIPLGDVLDKVYLSKDREEAAKNWGLAGEAYKITIPLIDKLNKVESTIGNAFTGAGADAKLSIAKGLSAVGVKISDKATDTEIANAISAQVVQQIAKVFPGSQSNKELEQLVKSKFNVQQELPTILRLIRQARDEMLSQKITYEQGAKLPDSERTKFNANLAQGQNYMKIQQYRDILEKVGKNTATLEEATKAKQIRDELGL